MDANVASVQAKFAERAKRGLAKYGVTTADAGLTRLEWLHHHQQELMDAVIYVEAQIVLEEQQQKYNRLANVPNMVMPPVSSGEMPNVRSVSGEGQTSVAHTDSATRRNGVGARTHDAAD